MWKNPVMEVPLNHSSFSANKLCTISSYDNYGGVLGRLELSASGIGWIPEGKQKPRFVLHWEEVQDLMENHRKMLVDLFGARTPISRRKRAVKKKSAVKRR